MRRLFSDRYVTRLVHPLCLCVDRCSHCQSPSRTYLPRLGLCSGPSLKPCHPRIPQYLSLSLLEFTQRRLPPFSIRTRSWRPLTRQPAWLCCKVWLRGRPELHAVRYSVRQYRYHCMAPSRERPEPLEPVPRRRQYVVGAGPREPLISPIIRLPLQLRPLRAIRWMPITWWRSKWTPQDPSTSASRFASSLLRLHKLMRLHKPSGTLVALPMTTALSRCPRLTTFAMQSAKRLSVFTFAQPQPCSPSSLPSLFGAPHSLLSHSWLRSSSLHLSKFRPWVRLPAMHLPLDSAQPQPLFTHGTCRWTQAPSLFSPPPQALLLKVPSSGLQLSVLQHTSWRTHLVACLWTTSRSTHRITRLLLILHLHLPTRNLNKQPRKPNIEHWRFCSDPPRHRRLKSETPPLSTCEGGRLQHPCRHLIRQATVVAAAAGRELRTIPWKRPQHRTSRLTCRLPSGAFQGDRIHSSLSSPTDCSAPDLLSPGLFHQGAARSLDVQEECWLRFSKRVTGLPMSAWQIACITFTNWVYRSPCALRPCTSFAVAPHAPSLPYLRSCSLSCNWPHAVSCTLWQSCCRCSAPYTAQHPVPPPTAVARMASRKEKRQDRQSRRPGSLNRRFTNDPSKDTAATVDATQSTPDAAVHPAPSAEPYRLTQKEVALLNYINWKGRTGKPPPLTVFAEPSLQQVLRGLRQKQRRPLPAKEDDVQVVADLIHVPDAVQTQDTQDTPAKLQPRPKTKHGSTTEVPPEPSRSSRSKQPTAISSDTSLEEMPCMIVAGDLTLASHDYGKHCTSARRRPRKRQKARLDDSHAAPSDAAASLPSEVAPIPAPPLGSSASVDITPPVSRDAEPGQCPRSSPTATSSFLAPPVSADTQSPDTTQICDRKPRESSPVSPVHDIDQDNLMKHKTKRTKDNAKTKTKGGDPTTKAKMPRADGAQKSKGSKLPRSAAAARSSVVASRSSKRRAASSTEIMDPDFRPDPATRPKIVSPWLEPMPKHTERYMLLSSFDFQSRHSLQQPPLLYLLPYTRTASLISLQLRPQSRYAFLLLYAQFFPPSSSP